MSTMSSARQRNFTSRPDKQEEKLFVFGYSCKIFRDDEKATYIDQGKHLIPWMGDENVMIDRYDVRGYLHDLKPYEAKPDSCWDDLSEEDKQMERLCDEERYLALRKDLTEEQMYQEEELKRLRAAVAGDGAYHEIGFTYDSSVDAESENQYSSAIKEELDDEPYKVPLDLQVPKGMEVPSNMKIHAIIEKTAAFISQQGGQMEIIIKMKQSSNPQFAFMHLENPLYPYYKHLVKEIKAGKYKPPETKKPVRETDDEDDDDHYLHPSLMSGKPDLVPKFTVPSISFRRTNDDSYSMLVKNLRQRIIDDNQSSSPSSQPGQENSNAGSPLTADDNSNQANPSDSEAEENKNEQPPPPGEEKLIGDEDGCSMSSSSSDVSDSPLTDSSDDEKESKHSTKVIPPPPNIKPIIDKMAEYVAKNGEDFEYVVKSKKDKRFDFLHPWHEYHQYYLMKRNEALDRQKPPPEEVAVPETQPEVKVELKQEPEVDTQTQSDGENNNVNHLPSQNEPVAGEDSAPVSGEEGMLFSEENGVSLCVDENTVNFSGDSVAMSTEDDSKINEVPCSIKIEDADETSQSSAIAMETKAVTIEEEKTVKAVTKVVKGPISFSLKPKDGDCGSLDRAKKRSLLLDDSEGEEESATDEKRAKSDYHVTKKAKEDPFASVNTKDVNNVAGNDKTKKLTAEELEAKLAEERIKDKLAAAARERLTQQKREKQLQLERKRRAALFLNMLKNNPVPKTAEFAADDATAIGNNIQKPGLESRLSIPPAENSPKEENGELGISPSVSEITSPRNGTVTTISRNQSPCAPPPTVVNSIPENDKWSSSSSSSSSSDDSSCERCAGSHSKDLSPSSNKRKKLKQKLESKTKKKKRKKHSHSSRNESHKEHKKQHSKSQVRSRAHGRHKSRKESKSRSHRHKRSRSRSHSKRTKALPAAYNVTKTSRSRSRSPRRHRLSSRLSPPHRMRRKL